MPSRLLLVYATIAACAAIAGAAQANESASIPPSKSELNVYLDCRSCDEESFHTEITFAEFVRDRGFADVHVLVTSQRTGGGGGEYSLEFIGKHRHDGMGDTLTYNTLQSSTEDDLRQGLIQMVKAGLIRFLARTPEINNVDISYEQTTESAPTEDKWNNWVFEIDMNTWLNGQESSRSVSLWSEIEARRVTENNAFEFEIWGNYNEQKFEFDESPSVLSISRSRGIGIEYITGLSDRWSIGWETNASMSTYSNFDLNASASSGIEYSLFPYSESTQRRIKFEYKVTANYVDYHEETIFDKFHEWLYRGELLAKARFTRPWGSVNATVSGLHYYHDFQKNRLRIHGDLNLRITQGLTFNINGSYSRIRNQLSLRKGGASEDEVLLRRRELATGYNYWTGFGISYSFGSIYNGIVNTRFD